MWAGGIIISIGGALTGWVFTMVFGAIKDLDTKHDELKQSFANHRLNCAENYATKLDVTHIADKIMLKLEKIDEKLDTKQDKSNA